MADCCETGTGSRTILFVVVGASGSSSATAESEHFSVISLPSEAVREYERHVRSLPTLDAVLTKLRERHATFDASVRDAREEAYRAALSAVAEGRMTRLHAERLRAGLTQSELAERAGMLQPNVSRQEKVGTPMSVGTAKRLARALGIADYRELLP